MEAKLIKKNDIFYLYVDESWSIASTDVKDNRDKKLSLKNCQAIELGYDLDELALYAYKPETSINHSAMYKYLAIRFFKEGFQKALEILGDKKFSEDDMIDCWETAHLARRFEEKGIAETNWQTAINYAQSLQQTEWDVEIVTHAKENGSYTKEDGFEQEPLLDANNCLILSPI